MSRTGLTISARGFQQLLSHHSDQRVANLSDEDYFAVIENFLIYFLNVGTANSIAELRRSVLEKTIDADLYFASSVASSALFSKTFNKRQLLRIREWLFDNRFFVVLSVLEDIGRAPYTLIQSNQALGEIEDRNSLSGLITTTCITLRAVCGIDYMDQGPRGIDFLSTLSRFDSKHEAHVNLLKSWYTNTSDLKSLASKYTWNRTQSSSY